MTRGADEHDRLTRIEEALGFSERSGEQLSEEIRALGERVAAITRRLDALERRLAAPGTAPAPESEDEEPPPAPPY